MYTARLAGSGAAPVARCACAAGAATASESEITIPSRRVRKNPLNTPDVD